MKNEDRKMLAEWLGECWHDYQFYPNSGAWCRCTKCLKEVIYSKVGNDLLTFTTPDDVFACKDRLKELGKMEEFENFTWKLWIKVGYMIVHVYPFWLFRLINEHGEAHFCQLVCDYLRSKEKEKK